jgi:hypothetical protein
MLTHEREEPRLILGRQAFGTGGDEFDGHYITDCEGVSIAIVWGKGKCSWFRAHNSDLWRVTPELSRVTKRRRLK